MKSKQRGKRKTYNFVIFNLCSKKSLSFFKKRSRFFQIIIDLFSIWSSGSSNFWVVKSWTKSKYIFPAYWFLFNFIAFVKRSSLSFPLLYPYLFFIKVKNKNIDINLFDPEDITRSNLPRQIFTSSLNSSKYLFFPLN